MGRSNRTKQCPRCGSKDLQLLDSTEEGVDVYVCADCDHEYEVVGSQVKRPPREKEDKDRPRHGSPENDWDR